MPNAALDVRLFPCLQDNYGILVRDRASGRTAAVDAPDGQAVLEAARAAGWTIDMVLNTHWHADHTQGNAAVKAATGAQVVGPAEVEKVFPLDRTVREGDTVELGATRLAVLETGGHTLGHVSYVAEGSDGAPGAAFVGDTLFAMGCGRLFEGSPEQMWASLQKLAALAPATQVWCAHEYTGANARFALAVDADPAVAARARSVFAAREAGRPTLPTTIGEELATNPMLRAPVLHPDLAPAAAFARVRAAKDAFKG